jgi:hypothetical protein
MSDRQAEIACIADDLEIVALAIQTFEGTSVDDGDTYLMQSALRRIRERVLELDEAEDAEIDTSEAAE